MKFVYQFVVSMAALALAEQKLNLNLPPPTPQPLPQLQGGGGGSRKDGFNVNVDATHRIWESENKRHSIDASAGYGQHLGGPYGNSRPDYRGGANYRYNFGK